MWHGEGAAPRRPLEGCPVLSFEGLFVAGIGGSHPLGSRERREERRQEEELGGLSGSSPVWKPGGYCGDALFANLESGAQPAAQQAWVGCSPPVPSNRPLSAAGDPNVSFFLVVILGHAVALIMYTKIAFLSALK